MSRTKFALFASAAALLDRGVQLTPQSRGHDALEPTLGDDRPHDAQRRRAGHTHHLDHHGFRAPLGGLVRAVQRRL